ncbi:MAG: alkaline phosphatase family protein, partial [Ilumatobacteraceae bacterium]
MTARTVPPPPRYGTASIGELLPAAITAISGDDDDLLAWPSGIRAVVVLVVDGLGRRQLDRHRELAPFIGSAPGTTLDAPFPTTTATSLTSLATGRPPGEHGLVGFSMRAPDHDRLLATLTWSWDRHEPVTDARNGAVPEVVQAQPTVFERAGTYVAAAVTVLHPDFIGSGLTRAALGGGTVVAAVDAAVQRLA